MSKESYVRGFCKAAEAVGVDPVALVKFAEDAGIGSMADNFGEYDHTPQGFRRVDEPHPGSYISVLKGNDKGFEGLPGRRDFMFGNQKPNQRARITLEQLARVRQEQASNFAKIFYPKDSAPFQAIKNNLIMAGKRNADEYRRTGTVKPRTATDKSGINGINLTDRMKELEPEDRKEMESKGIRSMDDVLRRMQDMMVNKGVPRTRNIA